MSKYISSSTKGFYDSEDSADLPSDAIAITDKFYQELMSVDARRIQFDKKGQPFIADNYEIDSELIKQAEVDWRNSELVYADQELNKVQDSDPKAIGSVADWRAYRKNLRAWPESEPFPDVKYRPTFQG